MFFKLNQISLRQTKSSSKHFCYFLKQLLLLQSCGGGGGGGMPKKSFLVGKKHSLGLAGLGGLASGEDGLAHGLAGLFS